MLDLHPVFELLLSKADDELNSAERAKLNAIHAMRQVRQSGNVGDALDHIFRSMEYLLKGYQIPGLFTEEERADLLKIARAYLTDHYADEPRKEQEQRQSRVRSVLSNINDTSLRTKWQHFCSEKKLDFSGDDEAFLWSIRKQRNENQHGRLVKARREDIQRAASMVEKAILASLV